MCKKTFRFVIWCSTSGETAVFYTKSPTKVAKWRKQSKFDVMIFTVNNPLDAFPPDSGYMGT
jgi:hypothetical protein